MHLYSPVSVDLARWISKYDVVMSPFSVITDTPPRGLSYDISCEQIKKDEYVSKERGWGLFECHVGFKFLSGTSSTKCSCCNTVALSAIQSIRGSASDHPVEYRVRT